MWARRCGCAPQWPSRLKVLGQSFASAAVGFVVFNYMNQADAGYLQVSDSSSKSIVCVTEWPQFHVWDADAISQGFEYRAQSENWAKTHECGDILPEWRGVVNSQKCDAATMPLADLNRALGVPLSYEDGGLWNWENDAISFYGMLFLLVSIVLWVSLLFHDLALLSIRKKNGIYDFITIRTLLPSWRHVYGVFGFRIWRRLMRGRGIKLGDKYYLMKFSKLLMVASAPFWLFWWLSTFMLVIVPWAMIISLRHPIKMSRCVLFLNCLACGLYGLMLSFHSLAFVARKDFRPQFAVTWHSPMHEAGTCTCGCTFPISRRHSLTLLGIGVLVAYKSFILAFRCLKGLRHSNWSNLMSVMFPIPLTVYEVLWTAPDGDAIQHRVDGQPVQGELAFDPFALMDEQPNSCKTTTHLMPALMQATVEDWTTEMVHEWLYDIGLEQYGEAFVENDIDGNRLAQTLTQGFILEEINMEPIHQKKLRRALNLVYTVGQSTSAGNGGMGRVASFASGTKSSFSARLHAGPKRGESGRHLGREYVGCCGFPCRRRARMSMADVGGASASTQPVGKGPGYLNTEPTHSTAQASPAHATPSPQASPLGKSTGDCEAPEMKPAGSSEGKLLQEQVDPGCQSDGLKGTASSNSKKSLEL